ncbi:MAG: efflux RND transporter periplasmic adaptor subunit [Magnetococcus sp. WYHC-3]
MKAHHLVLMGSCAMLLAGCGRKPVSEPQRIVVRYVEAAAVTAANTQSRSEYLAMVRGDVETDLGFKRGGVLEFIGRAGEKQDWQEGVGFSSNEVLAQLKQEDFISSLKSARANAELAAKEFERISTLRKDGAVSQQALDMISAKKLSAEAELSQAEQALQDSVLRAAYDGTVLARFANAGETISAGKTVLKIADLRQMSVELGVPDRLVGQIQVGQEVAVKISALEAAAFPGVVSEVGAAAKEGARLFRVVIKVKNPDGKIKSGMTASVALGDKTCFAAGSVLVPLSALVGSATGGATNQLAVFVIGTDNKAHERAIKTDDIMRSSIVVTDGLKPGEKVVSVGASTLYDKAPVDARPLENP